jgi:hypothetical protein
MVEIKRDFKYTEVKILMDIIFAFEENKEQYTISSLAKEIGMQPTSPYYNFVIKYLKSLDILITKDTFGNAKLVTINYKKLRDLIDDQKIVEEFYKYFNQFHICSW